MGRRSTRANTVVGLFKKCKHPDWDACACPYWGRRGAFKCDLARWAGQVVTGKDEALKVLARMRRAVKRGTFNPEGESQPPLDEALSQLPEPTRRPRLAEIAKSSWIGPAVAAEYLGLHVTTVYEACAKGLLRHSRLGHRTIRLKLEWVDEWLERNTREPHPPR